MATNPEALLAAAGIFGGGNAMQDPRVRALFGQFSMPGAGQQMPVNHQLPVMVVPKPVPVPVPVAAPQPNPFQGSVNAMADPRVQGLFNPSIMGQQVDPAVVHALFGGPNLPQPGRATPARQHTRRAAPQSAPAPVDTGPNAGQLFQQWAEGGQAANEPNIGYDVRHAMGSPFRAMNAGLNDLSQFAGEAASTPAQRAQQGQQPQHPGVFPTSYTDPAYDQYEAAYAGGIKNPSLAAALARIRTLGERSNNGQVSSAGAQTPYQISPATRARIMKEHGFDPWSSPTNAVRGAALALTAYTGMNADYSDPAVLAKAAGGYFAGAAGARNPFGNASDGGTTTANYVQRVLSGKTGLDAPFLNAYDPTYDNKALGAIGAERQALMTPFSTTVDMGKPPEMPKPADLPTTDFSQADADLQKLAPIEMSEKEKLQEQRRGFFGGMAKALMSMTGNEGIGTFLAHVGGAMLGGRVEADNDIQRRQDKFDDEMAKYNAAVYSNDLMKARTHAQEAQAQIQQTNEYNMNNWKVGYDRWSKGNKIDISGTNVIKTTTDENGKQTISTIPIGPAVDAAISQQAAQQFSSMGGRQMAGNQQVASMQNQLIASRAIQTMQNAGGGAVADGAAAAAPAFIGTFVATRGQTADLLGPDGAKSLEESISKQLQSQNMVPGSQDWTAAHDKLASTEIAKLLLANPQMMQKAMKLTSGVANSFAALDEINKRRETSRTDSRGRTTTSVSQTGDASSIF